MDELKKNKIAHLLVRLSIGFIFLYAGIGKLFMGAAPPIDQIITFMPASTSLLLLGVLELVVGLLLILGLITRIAAAVAGVLALAFIISSFVLGMFNSAYLWKDIILVTVSYLLVVEGAWWGGLDVYLRKK